MAFSLPVVDWAGFLVRRDGLIGRMAMETCNGCDGCGLRCMDGFTVTRAEYDAVQVYLASLPDEEVARIRAQEKTVPWPGAEDTGATVTFCPWRDSESGNCFVYPVRPTVCRLFGHTPWLPCPIEAVPFYPDGSPEVWSEYLRFDKRTWAEWDIAVQGEADTTVKKIPGENDAGKENPLPDGE